MNKKLAILAIILAFPLTATALPGCDTYSETNHGDRVKSLTKDLNLNDAQKADVETLFKELHEKFKVMLAETHTKMQYILTPEQRTKLEEINMQNENKLTNK
ncbi:hypothetical protein [Methylobacter sp.]|uniref:hypothetical protein n=1 Tax=Methylobacter sp. TaxID=2051955 RepID=UPI00248A8C3D|nr:hypothetical protein [Methylobacter sp.]MDI1278347.1 hypothetical protein [Methylobacter sp.]MDI1359090.1 hypothetical protein [Methylobacter sp.]